MLLASIPAGCVEQADESNDGPRFYMDPDADLVDFGAEYVGCELELLDGFDLAIGNAGGEDMALSLAPIDGPDANSFQFTEHQFPGEAALAPGEELDLTLLFSPIHAGENGAVLVITYDDTDGATQTLELSLVGMGVGDEDGDGLAAACGDCDDDDDGIHPNAEEECNGIDDDCDGAPADDEMDDDQDGFLVCADDCDDTDADMTPADLDGDGYSTCDGDCDDHAAGLNLDDTDGDGFSTCDGDCDDQDSDDLVDWDGDGYSTCDGDCDDSQPDVNPAASESCNGIDDNCDGPVDEGQDNPGCTVYFEDLDGDGYGNASSTRCLCGPSVVDHFDSPNDLDCFDGNSDAKPGQTQYYDVDRGDGSFDYDCDGIETPYYTAILEYTCYPMWVGCSPWNPGFEGAVPDCGDAGNWTYQCDGGEIDCTLWSYSLNQTCQ